MVDEWSDEAFARRWDATVLEGNPVRAEQLDILLSILAEEYSPGDVILDLGAGSGIVEEMIFGRIPKARVIGVDSSAAMIGLAHDRLRGYENRYRVIRHDLEELATLDLPEEEYGIVISVQTLHHLSDDHKKRFFAFVRKTLRENGLFLLLDRLAENVPALYSCYRSIWRRQERAYRTRIPAARETHEEHLEKLSAKRDHPASLEQHLAWLREAGFDAACLHLHGDHALFAARKVRSMLH